MAVTEVASLVCGFSDFLWVSEVIRPMDEVLDTGGGSGPQREMS
jgi:hypothetical protein